MRPHFQPPKRPPEIHDEPEPQIESSEVSTVYRVVTVVLWCCIALAAIGAILKAVEEGDGRVQQGMVREFVHE